MGTSHRGGALSPAAAYAVRLLLLAAAYYATARLGLAYASIGQSISLVWPPTGLAIAALVLLGRRYWPGVALGAFLANAATPVPLAAAAGIALGNTLEALVAAALLRRLAGIPVRLDELRHARAFVFVAAPVAAMVSAGIGVATLWSTGALTARAAPGALAVWWVGDLLGALVVAPVGLAWGRRPEPTHSTRGVFEIIALCLGTAVAAQVGLGALLLRGPSFGSVEYPYFLFPFVVWAALRFGARGASLVTFVVAAVAVWHTVHGVSPFVASTAGGTLFAVTCYLVVVAVMGIGLAAVVAWERNEAAAALRQSEEQVRQVQRLDSVGRLAGGVAHEANNQMSVVLGTADFVLRQPDLAPDVRADVETIRRAAERTAAVTAQLLAFSRRQLLKPAVVELNTFIRAWEPVLRRVMGEDCGVTCCLGSDAGAVRVDPGQLEQVLLNLALNARDAMPRGGHLAVETFATRRTEDAGRGAPEVGMRPGPYAAIVVSDTGHGMDHATLSRVFEPFFTTKHPGQGTGLGLSTVYGIVKQSDGYVWAYSEPGQGTTFKIYLPLVAAASAMPAAAAVEAAAPQCPSFAAMPSEPPPAADRVLVVEDEAYVRAIAKRALEEAGYQVLEAANGVEALEILTRANERIDLVFTDAVMPRMNGRDLAERVAELAPGMAVLLTSGYPDREIARRGLLAPGMAFIQKPFSPDAIVRTVRDLLETHRRPKPRPPAFDRRVASGTSAE